MAARPVLPRLSLALRRTVVHHARPPRVPAFRNPHETSAPRPTEGTTVAHPTHLGGAEASTSTAAAALDGTNFTFHHSPPPTAPSYTTGAVPDLLRWTAGENVRLTGEEGAPLRNPKDVFKPHAEWTQEMKNKIVELRAIGRTRSEIAKELNIPREEYQRIAILAPASKKHLEAQAQALEGQKASWGKNKTMARAIRERRKTFW